jgi:hypothetical protein
VGRQAAATQPHCLVALLLQCPWVGSFAACSLRGSCLVLRVAAASSRQQSMYGMVQLHVLSARKPVRVNCELTWAGWMGNIPSQQHSHFLAWVVAAACSLWQKAWGWCVGSWEVHPQPIQRVKVQPRYITDGSMYLLTSSGSGAAEAGWYRRRMCPH